MGRILTPAFDVVHHRLGRSQRLFRVVGDGLGVHDESWRRDKRLLGFVVEGVGGESLDGG
jgi:hypothetical protein